MSGVKHIKTSLWDDRFIPRRKDVNYQAFHHWNAMLIEGLFTIRRVSEDFEYVNLGQENHKIDAYKEKLTNLLLPNCNGRILKISSSKCNNNGSRNNQQKLPPPWPLTPRKKPLMGRPSTILDLPGLQATTFNNVVDWGLNGYIATIYHNQLYICTDKLLQSTHIKFEADLELCIRWDWNGTHLAAVTQSKVHILDIKLMKVVYQVGCLCGDCTVSALEYSANQTFVTGCTNGHILVYNTSYEVVGVIDWRYGSKVHNIRSSCRGNYLAVAYCDASVKVYCLSERRLKLDIKQPTKAIAWHPWCDTTLVVGGLGYLKLWNVASGKGFNFSLSFTRFIVDSLTFNPLSAELVVGYTLNHFQQHVLGVFKDLYVSTEEILYHRGRIIYLLWDPSGTKLASCSGDESLCIWDFFGTKPEVTAKFLKNKKKVLSLNCFDNLKLFGSTIR